MTTVSASQVLDVDSPRTSRSRNPIGDSVSVQDLVYSSLTNIGGWDVAEGRYKGGRKQRSTTGPNAGKVNGDDEDEDADGADDAAREAEDEGQSQ